MTAVQLSESHRMRSCYGRARYSSLITSTTTSWTRKEICTRLMLVFFFYQKQYNSLHTFFPNHSAWHLQCWSNTFWIKGTKSVTLKKKKKLHIHMLFVAFLFFFFLSISVQIGGALKLLFPPVIVFFFFLIYFGQIKQLWSERQGCMRDGNRSPWVKWSLVFTSHAVILK